QAHEPLWQVLPPAQALPQAPQLAGSPWVSVQTPPQQAPAQTRPQAPQLAGSEPWVSVQTPLQQLWPAAQALPQAPQLAGSPWPSVQTPPQPAPAQARPPQTQTPPAHVSPEPESQVTPHPPQLAGSEAVSRQAPLHSFSPGQHEPAAAQVPSAQQRLPFLVQPVEHRFAAVAGPRSNKV